MDSIKRRWVKTWMGFTMKNTLTCKIGKQNIHRIKLDHKTDEIYCWK
ncbi:hypothetical protein M099_3489 [Phocaeicola vulgatus str. 3975 RP4]|uniref:Uncharacterized protein n=1 Tax=Phocaeicola vulgatus str. 3975 RP4 TaxID=1339352 RepID=A0A069SB23_PHOVU|nr:hypothetical protein M099_3489 [Phocaeicola vulgatus str. 3975 RP4]